MATLIGPATVVTADAGDRVIENGGVVIENGAIAAVGPFAQLQQAWPEATAVAAGGRTLTPGLINAHAHFYGMFARGISLKDPPPRTFRQVLERLWWRLDRALDHRAVYLSAALGAMAALRAGCTTVIDHHASPGVIDGSLEQVADAVRAVGLRGCLCYEVSDRDGPERAAAGIAENVRFARQVARPPGGDERLAAKFGLHASFTLSADTLAACRAAEADLGTGFHIHCAEGPEDGMDARRRHGRSVVQRLLEEAVLGERTILAHCVHVDRADMELLARTAVTVSHQPHSNMGNAVGWARVLLMRGLGVRTALGTDGYIFDMVESMRTAAVLHSHATRVPGTGVGEFGQMLLKENARLASAIFGRKLGVLEEGAAADLVLWDYFPPTPMSGGNLPWHLQFGFSAPQVHSVWVAGEPVLLDRHTGRIDEPALAAEARALAGQVWERF